MGRVAVIGRGMIGSAAARHLTLLGHEVVLVGPSEPATKQDHTGVFASHYDEGRITRRLARDPFWAQISTASIERYREIESVSGIGFFSDVGAMMAGPSGSKFAAEVADVNTAQNVNAASFAGDALRAAFPHFDLDDTTQAFYEETGAGHISPRNLVLAQTAAAQKQGANVVDGVVEKLVQTDDGVELHTADKVVEADQVLLAAGAFSNTLLPQKLDLRVYARTVVLFEVDTEEVARLGRLPSLVLELPNGSDPYLLPPIRYPDGKYYLKLGGDPVDHTLENASEIKSWFRAGGSSEVAVYLTELMADLMPSLNVRSTKQEACVTMFTAHGRPYIGRISKNIAVATGGNGAGAKCSDELGRLGAMALRGEDDPQTNIVWKG